MNIIYTEDLISRLCIQPRSLDYITSQLNGVDPITAFSLLKEMQKKNILSQNDGLWLLEHKARKDISEFLEPNPRVYLQKFMDEFDSFKKPHPLDFEWRNTKRSVNYLTDLVLQPSNLDDSILILGMPTLFANLCKKDIPHKVTIVERNEGVISSLRDLAQRGCKVIQADIFTIDPEKVGQFSTVVMDPPWYEPHFHQFIWVANRCLKLGGRLIISIPPINTRPGVDEERIRWFSFCQKHGLCIENLYAKQLDYTMPFFEWNSTRVAGADIKPFWRKGDIAIFQKMHIIYEKRPDLKKEGEEWKEIEVDECRIRVNVMGNNLDKKVDFELIPLLPNQILHSVSSREPIRKKANVWTSGNRIFKTSDPLKLYSHLQYYKDGIVNKSIEGIEIFNFIKLISSTENEEHNQYLEWLYHEMETHFN